MKKIGIVIRSFEENDKLFVGCRKDVVDVFLNYPVEVIFIPIFLSYNQVINLVNMCDGVVLTGGDYFLENDFLLVRYLHQKNIPTLGICLGMQAMGLTFHGKEIGVNKEIHQKTNGVHDILIYKNTKLHHILGKERIAVNSRHQSGIINTTLSVSARSLDGVIEAIEDKNKRFFLGVEWHPETLPNKNSDLIFEAFIKSLE